MLPWSDGFMNVMSTGIPPHVALLAQMLELRETYGQVSNGLVQKIVEDLDSRQMGGVLLEEKIHELFHLELMSV